MLFPPEVPVVFAFHGYPSLIHRLAYKRHNHDQLHVRGFQEEGSTTTPFDMAVRNRVDRFHLAGDAIRYVPRLAAQAAYARQALRDRLVEHKAYIERHGADMPEIEGWQWRTRAQSMIA
jgi:xylulose-5-phosphate/fructose-6-phosphate phosphoketolase